MKVFRYRRFWTDGMEKNLESPFALCIENQGCEDLEKRKLYQVTAYTVTHRPT